MTQHVIETVSFMPEAGVTREQMIQAAEEANAFVIEQSGFVRRRLSHAEDGSWIEHIEWENMEAAKAAAAAIGTDERARSFVKAINGPSVKLTHSVLEVAVG